ncbi:thioesterase [Burkholderia plantarii]|nr:thioesterase [Burkholderia plantarii]
MLRSWIASPEPATCHLVTCPFAGGGSGAFRSWRSIEDIGLNISLAICPGRDHRMSEPAASDINTLANRLADELATASRPGKLVLAGHSMGAHVAFEACLRLEQRGTAPNALVLPGCHAPHPRGRRLLSQRSDRAFVEQLIEIGGTDAGLLSDPTLLSIFLPMLRDDVRITEAYRRLAPPAAPPVATRTLLVCGSRDTEVSREEVAAWREWLRHADEQIAISGDHFYVTRRPRALLRHIIRSRVDFRRRLIGERCQGARDVRAIGIGRHVVRPRYPNADIALSSESAFAHSSFRRGSSVSEVHMRTGRTPMACAWCRARHNWRRCSPVDRSIR